MHIAIDIGNTQIKSGIFDGYELIHRESFPASELDGALGRLCSKYQVRKGILSHVSRLDPAQISRIREHIDLMLLDQHTGVPFENLYATPETLGVDRIALAAAAVTEFPGKPVLVIDAGTCITYDFVNADRQFEGGSISPGITMRYKAVHGFTANLPMLEPEIEIPALGNSTANALHKGILSGVIHEIDGVIEEHRSKIANLTVVLTGGDAKFLSNNIKSSIFATPNFLLEGLNSILIYNLAE